MGYIAVFGSVFVDIKGFPFGKYLPTGRNVGDVKIVHGGVCRNVAEDLANVGAQVSFVTMFEAPHLAELSCRKDIAILFFKVKYG